METPYTTHITSDDFKYVYEPAEDSFLLLDALEADLPRLTTSKPAVCVEIGSGSGVIITALARALPHSVCFATDINPRACIVTRQTAVHNHASVNVVNMDLVSAFIPRSIDVLVFNPPYVVTPDDEITIDAADHRQVNEKIVKAWAGGTSGRLIMDRVFEQLDWILSPGGVAYILVIEDNKPEEIIRNLRKANFMAKSVAERRIRGEYLIILKIVRCSN